MFFFPVYIWQSKLWPGVCASVYLKQTKIIKKKHWSNLPSFSINYALNALVENVSQHAARSELY